MTRVFFHHHACAGHVEATMKYHKDPYHLCENMSTSRMISSRSGSPLFARSSSLWRLKCRTRAILSWSRVRISPSSGSSSSLSTLRPATSTSSRSRTARRLRQRTPSRPYLRRSPRAPPHPPVASPVRAPAAQCLISHVVQSAANFEHIAARHVVVAMPTFRMLYCLFRIPEKHSTFFRSDSATSIPTCRTGGAHAGDEPTPSITHCLPTLTSSPSARHSAARACIEPRVHVALHQNPAHEHGSAIALSFTTRDNTETRGAVHSSQP